MSLYDDAAYIHFPNRGNFAGSFPIKGHFNAPVQASLSNKLEFNLIDGKYSVPPYTDTYSEYIDNFPNTSGVTTATIGIIGDNSVLYNGKRTSRIYSKQASGVTGVCSFALNPSNSNTRRNEFRVKTDGVPKLYIRQSNNTAAWVVIDLVAKNVFAIGSQANNNPQPFATVIDEGDGWMRVLLSRYALTTTQRLEAYFTDQTSFSTTNPTYTGEGQIWIAERATRVHNTPNPIGPGPDRTTLHLFLKTPGSEWPSIEVNTSGGRNGMVIPHMDTAINNNYWLGDWRPSDTTLWFTSHTAQFAEQPCGGTLHSNGTSVSTSYVRCTGGATWFNSNGSPNKVVAYVWAQQVNSDGFTLEIRQQGTVTVQAQAVFDADFNVASTTNCTATSTLETKVDESGWFLLKVIFTTPVHNTGYTITMLPYATLPTSPCSVNIAYPYLTFIEDNCVPYESNNTAVNLLNLYFNNAQANFGINPVKNNGLSMLVDFYFDGVSEFTPRSGFDFDHNIFYTSTGSASFPYYFSSVKNFQMGLLHNTNTLFFASQDGTALAGQRTILTHSTPLVAGERYRVLLVVTRDEVAGFVNGVKVGRIPNLYSAWLDAFPAWLLTNNFAFFGSPQSWGNIKGVYQGCVGWTRGLTDEEGTFITTI